MKRDDRRNRVREPASPAGFPSAPRLSGIARRGSSGEHFFYFSSCPDVIQMAVRMKKILHLNRLAVRKLNPRQIGQNLIRLITWINKGRFAGRRTDDQSAIALKWSYYPCFLNKLRLLRSLRHGRILFPNRASNRAKSPHRPATICSKLQFR